MGYRGEDLDLRTPQTWSATSADLASGADARARAGTYGASRSGPIWVDETVLACCNHAYDVAVLNRAGEVRLEHLLHAMTRIDAAAEALEARGVRVAPLRRDSATVIASEIPIGLPNGKGTPRRSEALEEALRMAAGHSARRNSPASIEDVLHILIDVEPDLQGLALLARNMTRAGNFSEPAIRGDYADAPRARPVSGGYYFNEPQRAVRSEFHGTPTDGIQNTRIEALEQMVRALGNDLALERKAFSSTLQDVQREVSAQRDETGRMSGGLHERLQGVDSIIERRLGDLSRPWLQMNDRLQGLEKAVSLAGSGGSADFGPLNDRLQAIETALKSRPAVVDGKIDLGPLTHRLDMIEEAVLSREAATREIGDRLRQQEDVLATERTTIREQLDNVAAELRNMTVQIDKESDETASAVLDSLTVRLEGLAGVIESRHSDAAQVLASNAASIAQLIERMASAEESAKEQMQEASEMRSRHAEELSEMQDAMQKLNANQHTLAASIDQWHQDSASALSVIGSRMEIVERETAKPVAMLASMGQSLDRMHRVTVERYYRRNRFWYWLFGTDDWIASSWPAHATRIADDARLSKPVVLASHSKGD